ncbi:hypothetical protein HS1genome_0577 [Sulfodiicoccus acidiphilus]|uniref:Uncharacterized protein n=1 Tax=Sulfodiicoccus acidiphilus TaxID=1670455 RepID=A0A348B1Y6_9CREN|nr:hypothetical protein [Sulfodiicoccus acidiphilus]BBD72188.1 hypothetical protein HS1genome_0577 [Sulfodiicoccus acidiphilus]GGT94352.1 hypothetical protein GCM10007116_09930 [Sulfodiicoccus acidiphilus]
MDSFQMWTTLITSFLEEREGRVTPTEDIRTAVYLVQLVFLFFFVFLFDLLVVKNGPMFYGVLVADVGLVALLLYFLLRRISGYFNF